MLSVLFICISGDRAVWRSRQHFLCLALSILAPMVQADTWRYDWNSRTDRDGLSAGIFGVSPYPVTENSTAIVCKTDEYPDGKIYYLGTKYYVDGYQGNDANDGITLAKPKRTISAAIASAGKGNRTLIIRGAHDGFDGVYPETISFYGIAGQGDTNRFMLVGYGQERPIIDGTNSTSNIIGRGDPTPAFITIQRLKLQNTQASGVRLGWDVDTDKRDQYFNCVDIWFYACGNNDNYGTDGNCYYLNTDYGFLSHCLFERSVGHGVKIGDGSSHCILEWSVSRENGWWPGKTTFTNSRTVGIDLPSDRETPTNDVVRYCIASGCVSHGLELRRVHGLRVYCNEIYDYGHGPGMTGNMGGVVPFGLLVTATSWGTVSRNVIHDPSGAGTNNTLLMISSSATNNTVMVSDNLLYGATANASSIYLDYLNSAKSLIYNNTVVQSNSTYAIAIRAGQAWTNELVNNIVWQRGSGSCGATIYTSQQPLHINNLYYYPPQGSGPSWGTSGAGELVADPKLAATPSGLLSPLFAQIQANSPAINSGASLPAVPLYDINGVSRSNRIDVGAAQHSIYPPANLHVMLP